MRIGISHNPFINGRQSPFVLSFFICSSCLVEVSHLTRATRADLVSRGSPWMTLGVAIFDWTGLNSTLNHCSVLNDVLNNVPVIFSPSSLPQVRRSAFS